MLKLQRKPITPSQEGSLDLVVDPEQVCAVIDGLVSSRFQEVATVAPDVHRSLENLRRNVLVNSAGDLDAISQLGIESSEVFINVGWVYHDFRETAEMAVSMSSAINELAASITQISQSSSESAEQTSATSETMSGCTRDSRQTVEAMRLIEVRVQNIGERIATLQSAADQIAGMASQIDAISRQTNLLALNATIEASRAGEAGRGFAVVAQEVKALSLQTGKATQEIRGRLSTFTHEMGEINSAVRDSLKAVTSGSSIVKQVSAIIDGAGNELNELTQRAKSIAEVIDQQQSATADIARNVQKISEKSVKTRDELEQIKVRVLGTEFIARNRLTSSTGPLGIEQHLSMLAFATATWKRQLCCILLNIEPCPDRAPSLSAETQIAAYRDHPDYPADSASALLRIQSLSKEAQVAADSMVSSVRKCDWEKAIPDYIAMQNKVDEIRASICTLIKTTPAQR